MQLKCINKITSVNADILHETFTSYPQQTSAKHNRYASITNSYWKKVITDFWGFLSVMLHKPHNKLHVYQLGHPDKEHIGKAYKMQERTTFFSIYPFDQTKQTKSRMFSS